MNFRHALAFDVALSACSTPVFAQDGSADQAGAEEGKVISVPHFGPGSTAAGPIPILRPINEMKQHATERHKH